MTDARTKQAPFRAFLTTAVLATLFFVSAWYFLFGPAKGMAPSVRPAGVPKDATWVGGADGGAYVRCSVDEARNVDQCAVWNDFTGDLIESGDYRIRGQARAATEQELRTISFPDFDGHIYLEKEMVLDRMQPPTTNH